MLSGRDIILISSIEWDFNWQGHQEIASRLARAGNRVLYVENMGVRSPRLGDARRVTQRLSLWARALPGGGVREVAPNLYVCAPLILPPFGSALRRQLNRSVLLPLITRAVRSLGFDPAVIWTFLPTDTVASLIPMLRTPRSVVVYYCIADFAGLVPRPPDILRSEREVINLSDIVFAQGEQLAEHCERGGGRAEVFPFGVNLSLFAGEGRNGGGPAANGGGPAPSWLSELPRPVIGYVGGIHRFFDMGMLAEMARARPEWSWVLVGPVQTSPRDLRGIPNIYLAGPQPHDELPRHIGGFDVGIVPYLSNSYTATVVPTKINEYLAMGKPVVSTDLPEVVSFNRSHDVIITCPNQPEEFIASIEKALLRADRQDAAASRRAAAAANDWGERSKRMNQIIERELRKKGWRN